MVSRLVVIGGDAAGMSAASIAKRRRGDALDVVVLERGDWTSYSACGIPYWVADEVDDVEKLVSRSPDQHRERGIDVRMRAEAVALDPVRRVVTIEADRERSELGYDHAVIATGAEPIAPDLPGVDAVGVHTAHTLDDGSDLRAHLDSADPPPRHAVVIGGGYIGLEMAEALLHRGLEVTLVDMASAPMGTLDPDMGDLVAQAMADMGITMALGAQVQGLDVDDGHVRGVRTDQGRFEADLVVFGIGVRPRSQLAAAAGLELGDSGGIRVDERQAVPGHEGLWAAGDCVESWDRVAGRWTNVALGTHANKQGRTAGINLSGGTMTFPGVVKTAITKVCDLEIGRTGIHEREADELGLDAVSVSLASTSRAGYFPGAQKLQVKLLAERGSRRLLGAQIVGRDNAGLRIDICALALWNQMTVDDLAMSDLAYAPPFSPVWDPVQIAARKAAEALDA